MAKVFCNMVRNLKSNIVDYTTYSHNADKNEIKDLTVYDTCWEGLSPVGKL